MKIFHAFALMCLAVFAMVASPAVAMGTSPSTAPAPSRELVELREANGVASKAFNAATAEKQAASNKFFKPMIAAIGEATAADNPRKPVAFEKAKVAFYKNYNGACAILTCR